MLPFLSYPAERSATLGRKWGRADYDPSDSGVGWGRAYSSPVRILGLFHVDIRHLASKQNRISIPTRTYQVIVNEQHKCSVWYFCFWLGTLVRLLYGTRAWGQSWPIARFSRTVHPGLSVQFTENHYYQATLSSPLKGLCHLMNIYFEV